MAEMARVRIGHPALQEAIRRAVARFNEMTEEQKAEMVNRQRESWVRGEMGIGSDADEAAYRNRMKEKTNGPK
jgi:hypothetical protein